MTHYVKHPTGNEIQVSFTCKHPELKNNCCPTGDGDCANCRFCEAKMSAVDYFKIQDLFREKKETL